MLKFTTVLSPEQSLKRHSLIQSALRSESTYNIELEYPQVFANHENCITGLLADTPVVHASILYRVFEAPAGESWKAGLIGNVATDESFRGQGFQRLLFTHLEEKSMAEGADVLILWSDLVTFYQKLGFREFGVEVRYMWSATQLAGVEPLTLSVSPSNLLRPTEFESLMKMRPSGLTTLTRSATDFKQLIEIPETSLIRGFDSKGNLKAWAILGKGYDMRGVAHEWGALDPKYILGLFTALSVACGANPFMILAPKHMSVDWHVMLEIGSSSKSIHPMAMIKQLSANVLPEDAFIWGLDSI
jgi:GNAT superfamily N-acetyltransferase